MTTPAFGAWPASPQGVLHVTEVYGREERLITPGVREELRTKYPEGWFVEPAYNLQDRVGGAA